MDLSSIALHGLQQASAQLDRAASRIAQLGTSSTGGSADSVDLSAEMIAMIAAKNQFSANTATVKVSEEMNKSALDMMA